MYKDENIVHILTILEAIEKCFIYIQDFDNYEDFFLNNDQINFNASVALLIVIGEETKSIDDNLKNNFPNINWRAIAGMRDKMAHNYRGIDPEMTFEIIKQNLQELKDTLVKFFSLIDYDKEMIYNALNTNHYKHLDFLKNKL